MSVKLIGQTELQIMTEKGRLKNRCIKGPCHLPSMVDSSMECGLGKDNIPGYFPYVEFQPFLDFELPKIFPFFLFKHTCVCVR